MDKRDYDNKVLKEAIGVISKTIDRLEYLETALADMTAEMHKQKGNADGIQEYYDALKEESDAKDKAMAAWCDRCLVSMVGCPSDCPLLKYSTKKTRCAHEHTDVISGGRLGILYTTRCMDCGVIIKETKE